MESGYFLHLSGTVTEVFSEECYPPEHMEIAIKVSSGRPCHFPLCLQGGTGAVFADFNVDPDGRVFLVRISYDGYGCTPELAGIPRMSASDSQALLSMVLRESIDEAVAEPILREYFRQNRDMLWSEALAHHNLM